MTSDTRRPRQLAQREEPQAGTLKWIVNAVAEDNMTVRCVEFHQEESTDEPQSEIV
jgi:hypothetical protein